MQIGFTSGPGASMILSGALCSRIRCFSSIRFHVRIVIAVRPVRFVHAVNVFQCQSVRAGGGARVQSDILVGTEADAQPRDVGGCKLIRHGGSFTLGGKEEVSQPVDVHSSSVNQLSLQYRPEVLQYAKGGSLARAGSSGNLLSDFVQGARGTVLIRDLRISLLGRILVCRSVGLVIFLNKIAIIGSFLCFK